jgi:monoamine oxidase
LHTPARQSFAQIWARLSGKRACHPQPLYQGKSQMNPSQLDRWRTRYQQSRRQFLRRAGYAAGATAAATLVPLHEFAAPPAQAQKLRVIIVGAGLSGLCCAYELEQLGHEVVILEAETSHVGGRVRTARLDNGQYGELGAMRIPAVHNLTRYYIKLFGLSLRKFVQSNPEGFYFIRGQRVRVKDEIQLNQLFSLSPQEAGLSIFDNWQRAVLNILEGMTQDELDDLRNPVFKTAKVRALDQISLEAALKQAGMSPEAIELLASAWGFETSLQTGFTTILREEHEAIWSGDFDEVVGGLDLLPRAFAARLHTKPRMGCVVTKIEQNSFTRKAAAIFTEQGEEKRVEGDFLISTLPLGVMSRVQFTPELSGPKLRAMRQVTYDSSTKVLATARRRFWETEDGIYGGGTYTDLPLGIAYYPADNADARDAAVSAQPATMLASYTWGQQARRLSPIPHAERARVVLENLARIHPQLQQPGLILQTASMAWDNHPYSSGAFAWFSPGQHETLYQHLIAPEGRLFFAGEHASLTPTWQQGALESAQRVLKQLLPAWPPNLR